MIAEPVAERQVVVERQLMFDLLLKLPSISRVDLGRNQNIKKKTLGLDDPIELSH